MFNRNTPLTGRASLTPNKGKTQKSLISSTSGRYSLSVIHMMTGFSSLNTNADSRNHSVMRSFCVRSKPITPSNARIMVGRGGEAFAPAGFIRAGLLTLPRPATLFSSGEQVVKPTNEAATMATIPTPLHPEYTFHFLAVRRSDLNDRPHRESVTAPDERTARRLLARDFVLLFAGRVPAQEVRHGA